MNAWHSNDIAKRARFNLNQIPKELSTVKRREKIVSALMQMCQLIVFLAFVGGVIWMLI